MNLNPSNYPNNGLSFPLSKLIDDYKELHLHPIEILVNYVDLITKKYFENPFFLEYHSDLHEDIKDHDFEYYNSTTIGNLAYIALYSPSPYKEKALKLIENWREWKLNN